MTSLACRFQHQSIDFKVQRGNLDTRSRCLLDDLMIADYLILGDGVKAGYLYCISTNHYCLRSRPSCQEKPRGATGVVLQPALRTATRRSHSCWQDTAANQPETGAVPPRSTDSRGKSQYKTE